MSNKVQLIIFIVSITIGIAQSIYVASPIPPLEIKRCGVLKYKIPANTFSDEIDGDTRNLKLSLTNSTGEKIVHNWIAFLPQNQTLVVVLTDQEFKNEALPKMFNFHLYGTTKRGESAFATIQLTLNDPWKNTTVAFLVNFVWLADIKPPLPVILLTFFEKFAAYTDVQYFSSRFTHAMQANIGYSIGITNCTLPADKCDNEGIKRLQALLYTDQGTVPAFRNFMLPEMYLSYVQVSLSAVCQPPEPPRVLKSYPPATLSPCSPVQYPIPTNVFYDERDGYNLQLTITAINGKPINEAERWIDVNNGEGFLFGIVTDKVIEEEPPQGYNVTITAYDSQFLSAKTFMIIKIAKDPIQRYYQFTLHLSLKGNTFLNPFVEQNTIVKMLNSYFQSNFTNVISYRVLGDKDFTFRASICTLPLKCNNESFTKVWKQMVTSGNTPQPGLVNTFSYRFILRAVEAFIDPICLQALDPPIPSINPWIVPITRCGGFNIKINKELFYDKQDGNTRNLLLRLFTHDEKEIPTTSWLQLNSSSQTLVGLPTHEEIDAYNSASLSQKYYKIVAIDRSGMNGTLNLLFSIQDSPPATYTYSITYRHSGFQNQPWEVQTFRVKLRNFLGYTAHSSIGLERFLRPTSTISRIYYRNCSTLFDPCSLQKVQRINSRLFTSTLPTSEFKSAMQPEFTIMFVSVTNTTDCNANTPPRGVQSIPIIWVSVCGFLKYKIPATAFHDKQDGFTRDLSLSLRDSHNRTLEANDWLEWNAVSQEITFIATVSIAIAQEKQSYLLTASDKHGLTSTTSVYTSKFGPLHVLQDCQIKTKFQIDQSLSSRSNVYVVEQIITSMASYFEFTSVNRIGLVSILRESSTTITVSWSYCSAKYHQYTQSSTKHRTIISTVDVQGLTSVIQKIFLPGTFQIHPKFRAAFQGFAVLSVVRIFTGGCSNLPPVIGPIREANQTNLMFNISDCGYTKIPVAKNWFFDVEDGDAHNLRLDFYDKNHAKITVVESWVNFDAASKTILVSPTQKERDLGTKEEKFFMKATDSKGLSIELPLVFNIVKTSGNPMNFQADFYFANKKKVKYLEDILFFSDKISEAYSLSSGQNVATYSFHEDNGLVNSSILRWYPCQHQACSSSFFQRIREHHGSDDRFNSLQQMFLPNFNLERSSFFQRCNNSIIPPKVQVSAISFRVTMCGVSIQKLSSTLFSHDSDGPMKNLKIDLLNQDKSLVSASSWIQLNAATLQIYAVPPFESKVYQTNPKFYLRGANSQNVTSLVAVNVQASEEPYTNDCPITMVVKRKYGTAHAVDLGVLYKLLRMISNYYNDNEIKIKVLKFSKLSTYSYSVEYSNCSFQFASKAEAQKGFDESFRQTINKIISRMVTADGTVSTAFASFMTDFFQIDSVRVSYRCIEAPPYPTVAKLHRTYAQTCKEYRDLLSKDMFNDAKDGTNLKYSVTYKSGKPLLPSEWIAFDEKNMEVYGMVTEKVKWHAPFVGYEYLIVATDSSGRSANITYLIKIATGSPSLPIKFILAFETAFSKNTSTANVLVSMSRKIARYLDGGTRGDEILITSYTAGKSMTFGHCKLLCTQAEYIKVASKLQSAVFSPTPSSQFVSASAGSFVPKKIFINGASCLPSSSITIITHHVVTINWANVCGFIDYKIPDQTFSGTSSRQTTDFILSMYQHGRRITTASSFHFDTGYQSFHGPVVATTAVQQSIFDLQAKHPISGHVATTSLTLNIGGYTKYQKVSKSLCIITVTFTSNFNPMYSDTFIIKEFMTKASSYLQITLQELQITTYSRIEQFPVKMNVSFANCLWYSWLSDETNAAMLNSYISSRRETLNKVFANQQHKPQNSFFEALKPDFQLISGYTNELCQKSPNRPPLANITVIKVAVKPCTGFFNQISENAFSDEDGNARNLALQLYHADGSTLTASDWVKFNKQTQTLYGTPTKVAQSTNGGIHLFKLVATDKYGLIANTTISIEISGSAPGNENPRILINDHKITLGKCGIYRAALPDNFAIDKEDGSMQNLHVEMTMMDGSKIPRDSWVQFDDKTYEIYSLAAERTSGNTGVDWFFKVIVTDSCGGTASTTVRILTQATQASNYTHSFQFQSFLGQKMSYLNIQIKFLKLLSTYLKDQSSKFKAVSFVKLNSSEFYEFKFSNCSTDEYVCPKTNHHYVMQQNIFSESVLRMNSFAAYLSSSFHITSYQNNTRYQLDMPPSNSSSVFSEIEIKSCGGYSYNFRQEHFYDKESPSSVQLRMTLKDGAKIPENYPLHLHGKTLQVVPFGPSSNGLYEIKITAFDRCHLSSSRILKVRINIPNKDPGYIIRFDANVYTQLQVIYYMDRFKSALHSHLGDSEYGIEMFRYSRYRNALVIEWSSCYEFSGHCNKSDITYLHSRLFTATNVTDPRFVARLEGTFSNVKLTEYDKGCNFTSHEPPVSNGSIDISVDLCRKFEFRIPVNAFTDKEDGNTNSLQLSLLTDKNQQIPYSHWLQFNRQSQTVYGYPRYPSKAEFQSKYNYMLVAKDIQGNRASSQLTASIKGTTDITYKLTMKGRVSVDHHGPHVECEIILMQKIGQFFNDRAINDIAFLRQGAFFEFSWSFCKMQTKTCDCHYIKHVESLLVKMDEFKRIMSPEFVLYNVTTMRYGVCIHPSAPQVLIDKRDIYVSGGQWFSYYVDDKHFFDLEDGYTKNLTLYIANSSSNIVTSNHWLQANQQYICGLALLSEVRNSEWRASNNEYKLVARDACGKEAMDSFSVVMNSHYISLGYVIRVHVKDSYQSIRGNCTKMQRFVYLVSSYLKINSSDIYIDNIFVDQWYANQTSSQTNYTVVVWGTKNFTRKNCTNETVQSFREKIIYQNGSTHTAFYQYMKSDFDVAKVDDDNSSCANGTFVPIIVPKASSDFEFPLWILILLLILALLFLLCWLCWVCIPRCCAGCCAGCLERHCGCCSSLCGKCCIPGGKYASLDETPYAPDVEKGVLSNARTEPDVNENTFGKEAVPDEDDSGVIANPGSEPDSAPTRVDEDEMNLDQRGAPMFYAAPDYLTTREAVRDSPYDGYSDASKGQDNDSADAGVAAAPHEDGTGAASTAAGKNPYNDHGDAAEEQENDSIEAGLASLPREDAAGVAPLPQEDHQELAEMGASQSEELSSVTSSRDYIDEGSMLTADSRDMQQNSVSDSSYSRFTESENLEMPAVMPVAQAPIATRRMSLPAVPNVFSQHSAESRSMRDFENMVSGSSTVTETVSHENSRRTDEGRRVSVARPVRLLLPRQSVTSISDVAIDELSNNNNMMSTSNRRRSSQMLLLENDTSDGGYRDTGNEDHYRRVSVVRVSSDSSLIDDEPIHFNVGNDQESRQGNAKETRSIRRVSVISNGVSVRRSGYADDEFIGDRIRRSSAVNYGRDRIAIQSDTSPERRASNARRISTASRKISTHFHPELNNLSDYGNAEESRIRKASVSSRKISSSQLPTAVRRTSLSSRRVSSSHQPLDLFSENEDYGHSNSNQHDNFRRSRNSRTELLGYESDSTDSGYAITRQSKRYRRRSRDPSRDRSHVGDADYGKERVEIRRKSVTTVGTGGAYGRRGSRGDHLSNDYEMRSLGYQGTRNAGYESDSYV